MEARAHIVACLDGAGSTALTVLRGEAPLLPRRTGPRGGEVAEVHLVGGAAGPLAGDRLDLDVEVGPGAALVLRTVAAQLVLPGPGGAVPSRLTMRARIAAGGRFAWLPEPMVAAAGCDHVAQSTVELQAGAELIWRDELVAGRHGEAPGRLLQRTRIRRDGSMLFAQDLRLGPDTPWDSPAIVGRARAVANLVIVGPHPTQPPPATFEGPDALAARMPLTEAASACTAVATNVPALRRAIETVAPQGWLGSR